MVVISDNINTSQITSVVAYNLTLRVSLASRAFEASSLTLIYFLKHVIRCITAVLSLHYMCIIITVLASSVKLEQFCNFFANFKIKTQTYQ